MDDREVLVDEVKVTVEELIERATKEADRAWYMFFTPRHWKERKLHNARQYLEKAEQVVLSLESTTVEQKADVPSDVNRILRNILENASIIDTEPTLTTEQELQIKEKVKLIARQRPMQSSKHEYLKSYRGVEGQFFYKFGINNYEELPASRFDEAMEWLNERSQGVAGDELLEEIESQPDEERH